MPMKKNSHYDKSFGEDVLKKKKIEGKTLNLKSQIDDIEARSELTDEETQTSKTEENNNKFAANKSRSIMDQGIIGDKSLNESLFFQEKTLSQLLDSNKEKSAKNSIERSGHYSYGDKPLQIIKSEYNERMNDVIFTMNWKQTEKDNNPPTTSQVTRQDLLKYDPLLLVYYYEKHIEFPQYPNYSADLDLDRIPH